MTTDERLKERHKAQQKAFRNRHKTQADPAPSNGDLAIQRRERERRCAAGEIRELEKLPPQLKPPDLYPLMGSPVETLRGCGKLWQAFSGRVGVLLDEEPDYVTFMDLVEVLGGV